MGAGSAASPITGTSEESTVPTAGSVRRVGGIVPATSLVSVLTVSVAVPSTGCTAASTGAIVPATSLVSVFTVSVAAASTGCTAASIGAIVLATSLADVMRSAGAEPMSQGLNESPSKSD